MKDTIYVVFDRYGAKSMRKTVPPLKAGEYATRIDLTVDDKYFKRIIPIAKMELDDSFLIEPKIELEPQEVEEEETTKDVETLE
jgi:hypothetical protein